MINMPLYGGYNNEDCSFKTVLFLDSLLQGQCLQQIAPSCHNNLKIFVPKLTINDVLANNILVSCNLSNSTVTLFVLKNYLTLIHIHLP